MRLFKYFFLFFLTSGLCFGEDLLTLKHAAVGIYVVDRNTGKALIEKNSDLSLLPASCMKIVTTAAALQILGADSRFETHLEYDGTIDRDQVLQGNVYIRGGGDPCLGGDRIAGTLSSREQIKAWADAIETLKIRKIEGKIIGDASSWERALVPPSWSWEDLGNYYGAGASALSFHENRYSLFFKPGAEVGDAASILRTDPLLPKLTFYNEVKTGPKGSGDRACIYGSEFSLIQFVRGTIPAGVDEFVIHGAIPDPAAYCAELLTEELQTRGIEIGEKTKIPSGAKTSFHTTYSPTVGEIVFWTNQRSINLYAEHLLKKMGEKVYNEGSTAAGIQAVRNFWSSQGIDLGGFNMVDGSGLSRKNLITASQLVEILLKMEKAESFPLFFASLREIRSSIKAKSGTMSYVKGYAGYGKNTAFAVIVNQCLNQKNMIDHIDQFLTNLDQ